MFDFALSPIFFCCCFALVSPNSQRTWTTITNGTKSREKIGREKEQQRCAHIKKKTVEQNKWLNEWEKRNQTNPKAKQPKFFNGKVLFERHENALESILWRLLRPSSQHKSSISSGFLIIIIIIIISFSLCAVKNLQFHTTMDNGIYWIFFVILFSQLNIYCTHENGALHECLRSGNNIVIYSHNTSILCVITNRNGRKYSLKPITNKCFSHRRRTVFNEYYSLKEYMPAWK